ncbi:MAG TPA: hypothetical protein VHJ19_06745 [Gammaproteobacteria bacterium]|nr:hypothetical protein [Gammaproteobacteria bacterium]
MANHTNVASDERYSVVKRISWGAIFAGTILALVVQIMLSLLGVGIGLGVINPASPDLTGLGIGAAIWLVVSTLIALFIGGFVAARLAGMPIRGDGALHGVVVWGLGTLVSLYLATSAVGAAVSGVAAMLGQGFQLVGQGTTAVAPQVAKMAKKQPKQARQAVQQATKEAKQIIRQARQQARQVLNQAQRQAAQTAKQVAPVATGAAWGGFVALLLGAIAAGLGGAAGTPRDQLASRATR